MSMSPYRKKFSNVFARELKETERQKLNRIYTLQLLSNDIKISNRENKYINDIVLRYDCSERTLKVYKRRWFMLCMVMAILTISASQFLQFCIISNLIQDFFGTTSDIINLTSLVYMLIHCLLYVPIAFYFCQKQSLNRVIMIGALGITFTAWVKFAAVVSLNFPAIIATQSLCAIFHIFLSTVPSKLIAWFPKQEVPLVSSVHLFATHFGVVLNFLSLMTLNSSKDMKILERDLKDFMFLLALISTIIAFVIAVSFKSIPDIPPSLFEALKRDDIIETDKKSFAKSLKILISNRDFMLLSIGFGIDVGVYNAISTLLNSIALHYFPNGQSNFGEIGIFITCLGIVCLIGFAYILEKYKSYKMTSIFILRIQAIAIILFSLSLESSNFKLMCVSSVLLGIFIIGFQLVGQELVIELSFDFVSEDISVGILNLSGFFFGSIITVCIKKLQDYYSILYGNLCFSLLMVIAIFFISPISSSELRRLEVNKFIESAVDLIDSEPEMSNRKCQRADSQLSET